MKEKVLHQRKTAKRLKSGNSELSPSLVKVKQAVDILLGNASIDFGLSKAEMKKVLSSIIKDLNEKIPS